MGCRERRSVLDKGPRVLQRKALRGKGGGALGGQGIRLPAIRWLWMTHGGHGAEEVA